MYLHIMYKKAVFTILFLTIIHLGLQAQPLTDNLLKQLLFSSNSDTLLLVAKEPAKYRCQIIYTQINRDKNNQPSFKNYYFNYDPQLYFNPASMVKMPLAFLALEKLNTLSIPSVNKFTPLQIDSNYPGQKPLFADSTAASGLPSIAHFIKKAFLISDNDAYNRLYQFLGQQTINRQLHNKGYNDVRITRQFMGFSEDQNRHTNSIKFLKKNGSFLYVQPPAYNTDSFDFSHSVKIGKGHFNSSDSLVDGPYDFTKHNNLALKDFQQILQSVLFPMSIPQQQRFNLKKDDYEFLYRYLSQYPSESDDPKYDTSHFYDSYVKFFFRNNSHKIPANVRVFNKVGWAYGFMTDASYVIDTKNNIEYMLSATIYVNSDDILNDNKYDYETIGNSFFYNLGQAIHQYELKRPRTYRPVLSQFAIRYDKRNPNDKRPSIVEADN
jgi:hypothetical protein